MNKQNSTTGARGEQTCSYHIPSRFIETTWMYERHRDTRLSVGPASLLHASLCRDDTRSVIFNFLAGKHVVDLSEIARCTALATLDGEDTILCDHLVAASLCLIILHLLDNAIMKVISALLVSASTVAAFAPPASFGTRCTWTRWYQN
jgi:hypothetical protein